MHRDDVIETLDRLAGPLGPFTGHDELLRHQARWVDAGGAELFEILVELLALPPAPQQLQLADPDDWNILLVEITGTLGKQYRELALQRLLPLLDDERARPAVLDVLGTIGDARALPALERLVHDRRIGAAERIHLAGALGEIGGDAARLLHQLREAATPDEAELLREIEVALQLAARPGRP